MRDTLIWKQNADVRRRLQARLDSVTKARRDSLKLAARRDSVLAAERRNSLSPPPG